MNSSGTIQIMRDDFQPDELVQIVEGLKEQGISCAVLTEFSESGAALSDPGAQLLLVAAAANETAQLVEAIRSRCGEHHEPALLYFSQSGPEGFEAVLSEIEISF